MNAPAQPAGHARAVILRETIVSMAINGAIGAGFFFAVFGLRAPIATRAFGIDFLPQAFMVALMGSLVPALLVRRGTGATKRPVVKRAMLLAAGALVVAGGGALAVCIALDNARGNATIAPSTGLVVKIVFGMLLAAVVTPIAVRAALQPEYRA